MPSELRVDNINSTTSPYDPVFSTTGGALSHRNLMTNGAFNIWQRSTDVTCSDGSNEGYNSADRWYFNFNSGCPGTLDVDRSTDTPDGFSYSMKLKCNATGTPVGSTADFIAANMRIEAQDLQHLNYGSSSAKEMTLSWYMKSVNYTDPITVNIHKPDSTAAYYLKSFTPTTSWARYTMTIPANTTSGHTIANDTGVGLLIQFTLSGSDGGGFEQTGASSSWGTTYKEYINDIGNFFASTSNELYITGMQLELGSVATPFEHRSYSEDFQRCLRYYYRAVSYNVYQGFLVTSNYANGAGRGTFVLPQIMRAVPTFNDSGVFQTTSGTDLALSDIYMADGGGNPYFTLHVDNSSSAQSSLHIRSKNSTASYFEFTAEL